MSDANLIEVVRFVPELAPHFESLNRDWIEQYFEIEEPDRILFRNPYKEIVEPGGQIFFVIVNEKVVGTCAILRHGGKVYELGKMAVSSTAQGRGYGDLLMKAAINFAKQAGGERLFLVSNTGLARAIRLYEKHGFKSVPITDAHDYARVDIQMELRL